MPAYVPDRPPMTQLSDHTVGSAVSQRHGAAWRDTVNFLMGYCTQPIVSCNIKPASSSPRSYTFAYRRSPGARAVAIMAELHDGSAVGLQCTVSATRSGGAIAFLPDSDSDHGPLRNAWLLSPESGPITDRAMFIDILDVSGLTVGTLEWITLTWTDGPAVGTTGISRIHAFEVPRKDIAINTTDAGVDGGWPFAGNGLFDGASGALDGFKRFRDQLASARKDNRRHIQMLAPESVADAWVLGASVGVFVPAKFGKIAAAPVWWMRTRRLYETSVANPYKFMCRYTTQHATDGAELKITATSRTTGTTATATLTLAASATFTGSGEATLSIPTDGVDQEASWTYEFKTTGAANLVLSNVALIEDEV